MWNALGRRGSSRFARLARRRVREDSGFTLIEAVVSLMVAGSIFMALAVGSVAALHASMMARINQESVDALNQAVEQIRSYNYAAISMVTSDLFVGDNAIQSSGGVYTFDPGTGPEPIVAGTVGAVSPHVTTTSSTQFNGANFTIKRYITTPADATGAAYRRITVLASWNIRGQIHTRKESTLVVNTRRGLPLPRFTFTSVGPTTVTRGLGTYADFGFQIQNLGARDGWNITASSGNWTYYLDPNANGIRDAGENTTLGDYDANGVPDTGELDPNATFNFVAETLVGSSTPSTSAITFTATSIAQPLAASGVHVITDTLNTQAVSSCAGGSTTGCTQIPYYLHQAVAGNTTTETGMVLNASSTVQTTAYNYSTEQGAGIGRYLGVGGAGTGETNPLLVADYRYQIPTGTYEFNGTAAVTLYVQCLTTNAIQDTTVWIGSAQNSNLNNFTSAGSATNHLTACSTTGFTPISIGVPVADFTVVKNKYLVLRVELNTTSTGAVRLMYDDTNQPSSATLPQVKP